MPSDLWLFVYFVFLWLCVPVHTTIFLSFVFICVHEMHPSLCLCVCGMSTSCPVNPPCSPPPHPHPETQEESVDGDPGVAIPEINVTGVNGDRMANGDSLRPRLDGRAHLDGDMSGASPEVSLDARSHDSGSRSQEVRRQKSLRRLVENEGSGSASTGRSPH